MATARVYPSMELGAAQVSLSVTAASLPMLHEFCWTVIQHRKPPGSRDASSHPLALMVNSKEKPVKSRYGPPFQFRRPTATPPSTPENSEMWSGGFVNQTKCERNADASASSVPIDGIEVVTTVSVSIEQATSAKHEASIRETAIPDSSAAGHVKEPRHILHLGSLEDEMECGLRKL
jgi:hypothetical protein